MGDGCGIAYDSTVVKGVNPKKFDDFWRQDKVPYKIKNNAIIGHDRKASVGAQTLENTQPICFEGLNTILAHNGTISNFKEMYDAHRIKDHFDYNIVGMSDSQVMGLLMEKSGWQVLEEYQGSMAFLYMRGDDPGAVYAYHGKSKLRKAAHIESEERPLYFAMEDDETWLCSTKEALAKIIQDKSLITELPFNKVFRFDGEKATIVKEIDRSGCTQMEEWTSQTVMVYDEEDRWSGNYAAGVGYGSQKNKRPTYDTLDTIKKMEDDKAPVFTAGQLYYEAGFFKIDNDKANGLITITSIGRVIPANRIVAVATYAFYFIEGNLVKSEDDYVQALKTILSKDYADGSAYKKRWMLGKYYAFPYYGETGAHNSGFMYSTKPNVNGLSLTNFSGIVHAPFSARAYKIDNGRLSKVFLEDYRGIDAIEPYQVLNPTEDLLDKITEKEDSSKGKESNELDYYACPICLEYGQISQEGGEVMVCPACNGDKMITKKELIGYINSEFTMKDQLEHIISEFEEEKVLAMVVSAIDRGIDILDASGYVSAERLSQKLNEIKMYLWEK